MDSSCHVTTGDCSLHREDQLESLANCDEDFTDCDAGKMSVILFTPNEAKSARTLSYWRFFLGHFDNSVALLPALSYITPLPMSFDNMSFDNFFCIAEVCGGGGGGGGLVMAVTNSALISLGVVIATFATRGGNCG